MLQCKPLTELHQLSECKSLKTKTLCLYDDALKCTTLEKNQDCGINSYHFMANRWGKNRNSAGFIFLVSKITAYGDCNHEIKRHLLLGRKARKNLGSILKSRDITLLTKVHLVKATFFPVVMYGFESWTIKKAEH